MLRFNCLPGFILVGNRYATCIKTKWDTLPPVCVNTRCPPFEKPEHSILVKKYDGAVVMVVCEPGYEHNGPAEIYCNGKCWNETAPVCRSTLLFVYMHTICPVDSSDEFCTTNMVPTSCDFESPDLCRWEQDPLHDFDWIRHNFNTPSWNIGTGPSHDHTLGAGNNGYYMYIEATDKIENSTARLMSPLYSANLTAEGCFSFWYHMYGTTIGTLNVYFKAEGEADRKLMFTKSGNQGNQWWHGFFHLPRENTSFQLIMEGVRGAGYISDIAVDDVAILQGTECMPDGDTTTIILPTGDDDDGTDFTSDYSENPTESIFIPPIIPDRLPIPISPKDDIDPFVSRPAIPSNTPTTGVPSDFYPKPPKTTTKKTPFEVITSEPGPKRTTVSNVVPTDSGSATITRDFDKPIIDTNKQTETDAHKSSREPVKVTLPGAIGIVVGAIVGVAVMGGIVYRVLQKRQNYKNGAGKSALSEDSDVRFLTSDEILDFNLAKPEDMEVM
ncbi:MAM and LDL-receptor class A domain-containing protein 1-like [Athalia rosae]|uniref:MAM and LDL-receptor class A domain-containing protein 1-like n=1 Tax=Athalia rosae TaxID=37344 RepID=UPI002033C0FC|nr:MAM and LDL-receptor class A domain-containing protein 1-like [Athalia rosae]